MLGRFDGTHWGQGLVGVFLHSYTNALSFQGVWAEKLRRRSIILGASMSTERAPPPPFGSVRTVVTLDVVKSLPALHEVSSGREAVVRGPVYSDVTAADLTNAMGVLGDYTEVSGVTGWKHSEWRTLSLGGGFVINAVLIPGAPTCANGTLLRRGLYWL